MVPPSTRGVLGEGLYAYTSYPNEPPYQNTIYVLDLADGSRRRYDLSPTGDRWLADSVEWVTRDEVAFAGAGRITDSTRLQSTLVRVRLSAFVADPGPPSDAL